MENVDEGEVSSSPPRPNTEESHSAVEKPNKIFITDDEGIGDSENNTPRPGSSMAEFHPPTTNTQPPSSIQPLASEPQSPSDFKSSDLEPQSTSDNQHSVSEVQPQSQPQPPVSTEANQHSVSEVQEKSQPRSPVSVEDTNPEPQPSEPHPPSELQQPGADQQQHSSPSHSLPDDDSLSGQTEKSLEFSSQRPESAQKNEVSDMQTRVQVNGDQLKKEDDLDGSTVTDKRDIPSDGDFNISRDFKSQDSEHSGGSEGFQKNLENEVRSSTPDERLSSQNSENHISYEMTSSNPEEPPPQISENLVSSSQSNRNDSSSSPTLENHISRNKSTSIAEVPVSSQAPQKHNMSSAISDEPTSSQTLKNNVSSQLQQMMAGLQDYHSKLLAQGSVPDADDDEKLKKTLMTVTAVCQSCCSTSAELGKQLQQARQLTDNINKDLTQKLHSADLNGYLPLGYCMKEGESLAEERQATERKRLARAAEARAAVTRASHAMQVKSQELARAEAELMEAELAAAAAVEVAEEAVLQLKATKAVEEARRQEEKEDVAEGGTTEQAKESEEDEAQKANNESPQNQEDETPEDKEQQESQTEEVIEQSENPESEQNDEGKVLEEKEEQEFQSEEVTKQSESLTPEETYIPGSATEHPEDDQEPQGPVRHGDSTEPTHADTEENDAIENLNLQDELVEKDVEDADTQPEDLPEPELTTQKVFGEVHVVQESQESFTEDEEQNSENWPRFIYSVDAGDWDTGLGCVVRADGQRLGSDDLEVSRVVSARASLPLRDSEDLVSNIISLRPSGEQPEGTKYRFSPYLLLSLPHCAPRLHPGRELAVRMRPADGEAWKDLEARDVTFEDIREHKFVEARVWEPGTLCVVLRLKREGVQITRQAGRFLASADSRVTLTWPQQTVNTTANVTVAVQLLDQNVVSEMRTRTDIDYGHLMSSSPIVHCHSQGHALLQPVVFTLPCPPNSAARPTRPASSVPRKVERVAEEGGADQRPATARPLFSSVNKTEEVAEEEVHVLWRQGGRRWTKLADVRFLHSKKKDLVVFEMHDFVHRILLLRTRAGLSNSAVESTASALEHMLTHHPVHLVLKQHAHQPHQVVLTYSSGPNVERTLRSLAEEGYSQGPTPSSEIRLREGQVLELSFRGNLKPSEECGEFVPVCAFHTTIPFRARFSVTEIDEFAQKGFPSYRGFVQFTATYVAPFKRSNSSMGTMVSGDGESTRPLACFVTGKHLVAELLASLPKPDPETPQPLTTAPVSLKSYGPVTNELLRHVAQQLAADDWRRLVPMLNIRRTRLQAILRQNMTTLPWLPIYDVLLTWSKRLPQSFDRVEMLCAALMAVGRNDLVEEVRDKDQNFRQTHAQSTRESLLNKAFVRIARHEKAVSQWRRLALFLGLSEDQVKAISEGTGSARERCILSLREWKSTQDESGEALATVTMLSHKLRLCRYRALARDIESIR